MLAPLVRTLALKRFRSIPAARIELGNPTFLVGRNGSGKSNLVDAFGFLSDAMAVPLQAVFDRRGGIAAVRNRTSGPSRPPNIGLLVELGRINGSTVAGRYAFEVRAQQNYGFQVVREQCMVRNESGDRVWFDRSQSFRSNLGSLAPALDPSALALPLIGGDSRFAPLVSALAKFRVYKIEPAKLREMQDPDGGTNLRPDGSNAASVLQEIARQAPDQIERIGEILKTIVPNTGAVSVKKHGNKLALEFTQEWADDQPNNGDASSPKKLHFEAFSMSDGTLRALGLLTAVFQRPTPSLLVIEEPEATIHPGALGAVLEVIRLAAKSLQVVVTTHSPEVLDAKWIRPEHLKVVEWAHGATRVSQVSEPTKQALQDHVLGAGDLLRTDALRSEPLFEEFESDQTNLFDDSEQ